MVVSNQTGKRKSTVWYGTIKSSLQYHTVGILQREISTTSADEN